MKTPFSNFVCSFLIGMAVAIACRAQVPNAVPETANNTPMPADAKPVFAAVTIKPDISSGGTYFRTNGRHILAVNVTVGDLILYAYGGHPKQIVGGPSWLFSDHFDLDGIPDLAGRPSPQQTKQMMKELL